MCPIVWLANSVIASARYSQGLQTHRSTTPGTLVVDKGPKKYSKEGVNTPSRYWLIATGSKAVEHGLYKMAHGRQKPRVQVGRVSRRQPSLDVVKS